MVTCVAWPFDQHYSFDSQCLSKVRLTCLLLWLFLSPVLIGTLRTTLGWDGCMTCRFRNISFCFFLLFCQLVFSGSLFLFWLQQSHSDVVHKSILWSRSYLMSHLNWLLPAMLPKQQWRIPFVCLAFLFYRVAGRLKKTKQTRPPLSVCFGRTTQAWGRKLRTSHA